MKRKKPILPTIISLLIGIGSALFIIWLNHIGRLETAKGAMIDLRVIGRGERKPPDEITIVTWDEDSMSDFNLRYQDWPRSLHAKVIDNLSKMGAKIIAFDIIISEQSKNRAEDAALIQAIQKSVARHVPVVFDAYQDTVVTEQYKRQTLILPYEAFLEAGADFAIVNIETEPDGFVRRTPLAIYDEDFEETFPFLPLYVLSLYEKVPSETIKLGNNFTQYGKEKIPSPKKRLWINYYGPNRTFRIVPYYQVARYIEGKKYPEIKKWIKDKIVLVGIYTDTLGRDVHLVPFSRFAVERGRGNQRSAVGSVRKKMPGVEVMANILATLLKRNYVKTISPQSEIIILLMIGILSGFITYKIGFFLGVLYTLGAIFLVMITAIYSYALRSFILPAVTPSLTLFLTYGGVTLYRGLTEQREKKRIRNVFQRYISESVVNEVLDNPEAQKLGGMRKECTIFFSDIRGFTSISESLPPEDVVSLLNEYLSEMNKIIFKYEGTLDKYIGDAVMAIWGAPSTHPDDALRALKATLEMVEASRQLSKQWEAEGKQAIFVIGAGVNTGDVIVGNIGSEQRRDYTVIGDSVNLASRLEGVNKIYGTQIVIGEATYKKTADRFIFRPLDIVAVKGKQQGIRIFELLGEKDGNLPSEILELSEKFSQAFQLYLEQKWDEALKILQELKEKFPEDKPTQIYIERCQEFKKDPPGENWDGVARLKTK